MHACIYNAQHLPVYAATGTFLTDPPAPCQLSMAQTTLPYGPSGVDILSFRATERNGARVWPTVCICMYCIMCVYTCIYMYSVVSRQRAKWGSCVANCGYMRMDISMGIYIYVYAFAIVRTLRTPKS